MTFIKGLFNKKKAEPAKSSEAEKPAAPAKAEVKPAETKKPAAPAKAEAKATEVEPTPAPEAKSKGVLGGLFSSKKSTPEPESEAEPRWTYQPTEDANSYFLDADSSKSFGNIDYMRTAKTVKKTFPKMGGSAEGAEVVEVTSSLSKTEGISGSFTPGPKEAAPEIKPSKDSSDRNRRDTGMDMFRKMAKDIKK
jgi:hypothetical protein